MTTKTAQPRFLLQGHTKFQGLDVSIENKKGSVRRWYGPHGKETGSTPMHFSYGYIKRTKGTDGDHVDVYLGPNTESTKVFVIDQMKKPEDSSKGDGKKWTKFDEQKCMLGFDSAEEAKKAYLKQYGDPRFFGSMKEMTMESFKEKVMDKENHGKKVASWTSVAAQKIASELTESGREHIKPKNFVFPKQKKYPIHDEAHARNALTRVSQFGSKGMQAKVRAAVDRKFPGIELTSQSKPANPTVKYSPPSAHPHTGKEKKSSDDKKVQGLSDRLDDVGISLLAAPYAAKGLSKLKTRGGLAGAVGRGADVASRAMHRNEVPMELAGLSLVAPGVTHNLAKGITKVRSSLGREEKKTAGFGSSSISSAAGALRRTKWDVPFKPTSAASAARKEFSPMAAKIAEELVASGDLLDYQGETAVEAGAKLATGFSMPKGVRLNRFKRNITHKFQLDANKAKGAIKKIHDKVVPEAGEIAKRRKDLNTMPKTSGIFSAAAKAIKSPATQRLVNASQGAAKPTGKLLSKKNIIGGAALLGTGAALYGAKKGIDKAHSIATHERHPERFAIRPQTGLGHGLIGQ